MNKFTFGEDFHISRTSLIAQFILVLAIARTSFIPAQSRDAERWTLLAQSSAVQVAHDYVAARFPEFDTTKNPPVVHDYGDSWEVEYDLPKDTLGGTPVVIVDKRTLTVLRSFHTQ
jgi:hypothetical protein